MSRFGEFNAQLVHSVREAVDAGRFSDLIIDDLTHDDLPFLSWSGSPLHIRHVEEVLQQVPRGEVEYLALRGPGGMPVAKGAIDYTRRSDAGTLCELATHPELQSMGLGTRLIAAAEERIALRGRPWAVLSVETGNVRARALYERLGYRFWRCDRESWDVQDGSARIHRYEAEVAVLRKRL